MTFSLTWRHAGIVAAGLVALGMAAPAQAEIRMGDVITIHESVEVDESHVAIWARFGSFCGLTEWVGPVTTCVYDEGTGQLGSVRRIFVEGLGELREVMSVQGATSYTYEVISDGDLKNANYRSTVWTVPGARPGTAIVQWRTTMDPAAFPDDGGAGLSAALEGVYRSSLHTIKAMAEK